jgi:two-component system sensor histidine kinase KdpD
VALETAISWFCLDHRLPDIVMVYVLGVVVTSLRFGYLPSLVATALSVSAFDFFFTRPYFSFAVEDRRYVVTFAVMLVVALVIANLAERARREARAAQRATLEIENERLRNALLSSVSHDLRTPLAVVQGAATALLDGDDRLPPERRREYLETIAEEARRLNRLVRNLLDMTTLQAGALRVRKDWHPLEEMIGLALNRLEDALGARPVAVRIEAEASLVHCDAALIEQVLVNLVDNAIRYTPTDSRIGVAATLDGDAVAIEVTDDGPGVPAGQEEIVFQKFHRAATTDGGMGLGLAICRGMVEAHGGAIRCRNQAEGGASFRFTLPLDAPRPPAGELPEMPAEVGPS